MDRVMVKPELFRWACERAGFEPGALAERFPRLDAWQRGEAHPTLKQLESFAQATHTPVGYLFLPEPPVEEVPIPDFRTMGNERLDRPSADLLDTLYLCQQRQEWYRDFARTEGEEPLPVVGSVNLASDVEETAARMRSALGFDLEERRRTPTWTDALRRFIGQADELGVLVMVSGASIDMQEGCRVGYSEAYEGEKLTGSGAGRRAGMKESQHIEWKETWRDEYLRWICGFANAEGGVLVLGRNDKGEPIGVDNSRKLLDDLPNKIRDVLGIMADVHLVEEAGKDLVEIRVEPYPSPISYKGEYHYRSGSTKQELKGAALERFLLKKRGRHWDDAPEPSFTVRSCSAAALRLFKQRASESGRMDRIVLRDGRELLLGNLELVEKHGLKRAACLLFSDRPEQYVSGAWIKIGFFVTDDDLRYHDEIHGNLFEQVEKPLDLLHTKYLKAYISYHGLQRRETFLFPHAALREALLNAVVHKDYSSGIPIQISVYDDQIVLWNPGDLPESWTLAKLLGKHPSCPFNPLIANAFFRAGYIESWGRGIQKIQRECREHGIEPPVYDFGMAGLLLTFRANPAHLQAAPEQRETAQETAQENDFAARKADRAIQETGQECDSPAQGTAQELFRTAQETTQEKILALLRAHPLVTRRELASRLGLSDSGIKYHLEKMKAAGVIRHVGATKSGYWEVVK